MAKKGVDSHHVIEEVRLFLFWGFRIRSGYCTQGAHTTNYKTHNRKRRKNTKRIEETGQGMRMKNITEKKNNMLFH